MNRHSDAAAPQPPLSILHVAAPAHYGGLESVIRELARGHLRRGHTVRVALILAPGDLCHPLVAALETDGVTAIPLHIGSRDYFGERRVIRALCAQHRPNVLHTHGYRCDVVDGAVALDAGIRAVSTCHGFIEQSWKARVSQWLQRRALKRFDAVVAVSQAIRQRLIDSGIDAARVHLVPNAATVSEPLSRQEARIRLELPNSPVIGWVGRLSAEKGPDIALEAFALLRHPDTHLLFIGSGREAAELHALATTLGVGDRVIWRGSVPNAGTLFRAFDTFLLSSRTEGTPMALLEAIAAGVPVVATRVGGVPDVLDSQSAHLVESGDVSGLAAGLADVLRNPDLSRAMAGRASATLQQRYSVEPWLSSYESIYRGTS